MSLLLEFQVWFCLFTEETMEEEKKKKWKLFTPESVMSWERRERGGGSFLGSFCLLILSVNGKELEFCFFLSIILLLGVWIDYMT